VIRLKRTLCPTTIALPSWTLNDLFPYLQNLTETFFILHKDLVGGAGNVNVIIDEWLTDEQEEDTYNEFHTPFKIEVEFNDDIHRANPPYGGQMHFTVFLKGLQNFVLDASTMVLYQIFHIETISYGNGEKRDYNDISLKLIDYLASQKIPAYYPQETKQ
jgi:hypothetical protein